MRGKSIIGHKGRDFEIIDSDGADYFVVYNETLCAFACESYDTIVSIGSYLNKHKGATEVNQTIDNDGDIYYEY